LKTPYQSRRIIASLRSAATSHPAGPGPFPWARRHQGLPRHL